MAVAGAAAFLPLAAPLPLALPWALLPLPFDLALEEEPRTASRSSAARSVRSHVKVYSGRPKWPYAAVGR